MIIEINTNDFQTKSKELLKKVKPRALIVTTLQLPFNLNIPHNHSLISKKHRMMIRSVQPDFLLENRSAVEVHALLLQPITKDNECHIIKTVFEESLFFLNHVIETMILTFKETYLYDLSPYNLQKNIPIKIFRATTYNQKKMKKFLFSNHKKTIKSEKSSYIRSAELNKLEENLEKTLENPFRKIQLLRKKAVCFYENGEFYKGFFHYSTVMELYMFAFAKEIFLRKGKKKKKIKNLMQCGYKMMIVDHLGPYLKGNGLSLDISKPNSAIYKYWHQAYFLRNKVIHEGAELIEKTALKAKEICDRLINLLTKKMKELKYERVIRFL